MAVSNSREIDIEATPEQILVVIADIDAMPGWAAQYQSAEILDTYEDGKPRKVRMKVKSVGITDEQVIEYTWTDHSASWTLLSANALKSQLGKYTLTPKGAKTTLRFDIEVDLLIPVPGFLVKKAMNGAMEVATDGLRKQVLKVIKGG